ncbi:MAG: metallophosphoesterase family protein [Pseudomonadota bacterium]|nr:metallophosphoesterase family protein [Pseudomonadota bacterium]
MKLHILSDLHIEFADFVPPATDADVIVLAGDIGVGLEGLYWAESCFPDQPVIYVPGNHEYYHHDITLTDELKHCAPQHIHVLNDDPLEIDGVRFLGSVLWTDFALFGEVDRSFSMQRAGRGMNDFALIQCNGAPFTPDDALGLHAASRDWLAESLADPFDGKTVVVTHHAPSARSVAPRYARNHLSPAFASNLEPLMDAERALLWIHGHIHDPCDYEIHGTRVVCNPRGYAPHALAPAFRPDLVVEI